MKNLLLLLGLLPSLTSALDAPVVGITATSDGDSVYVTLAWDPVPGAVRYQVHRLDQFLGSPTLISDNATSPFQTTVPTGWNWQAQPDVLKFFNVKASDEPLQIIPMIFVPAGTFMMGQVGIAEPVHQVTLTHDFWLGETEVTNQQFLEAAQWALDNGYATSQGNNLYAHGQWLGELSFMEDRGEYPKSISWYGAACFCDWQSVMSGLQPYYNGTWNPSQEHNPYESLSYRLPTEAEWEHAARFDDGRIYPWGNDSPVPCYHVDVYGCGGGENPVRSYPAGQSELGLYDMGGSYFEWVNDVFTGHTIDATIDPYGPEIGLDKAVKSASYGMWPWCSSSAYRRYGSEFEFSGFYGVGFRICKSAN